MSPRQGLLRSVVTVAVLGAIAYLIGGLIAVGVAMGAQAVLRSGRATPALILAGAASLMLVAAGATIGEATLDASEIGTNYAVARPVAASAGLYAAVLLLSAVTELSLAPEHRRLSTRSAPARMKWRVGPESTDHGRRQRRALWFLAAGSGVAVGVVSGWWGPRPLPVWVEDLVLNVNTGIGYARTGDLDVHTTGLHAPAAPLMAALGPGGVELQRSVALGIMVMVLVFFGFRLGGLRLAGAVALVAPFVPLVWTQQLPTALASLGIAVAMVLVVYPDHRLRGGQVVAAGASIALAVLAVPWALVAGVAVRPRQGARYLLLYGAVIAVLVAPWALWVNDHFADAGLSSDTARHLAAASAPSATGGSAVGTRAPSPLPEPGAEDAAAAAAWDEIRFGAHFQPQVMGARALRTWDLWSPGGVVAARDALGQPNPGGRWIAGVSALGAIGSALGVIVARRRNLGLLAASPLVLTVVALVTYGDRGIAAMASPGLLMLLALAVESGTGRLVPRQR